MPDFDFDIEKYTSLLKAVSSMSKLYSDNDKAFLHSRFIEKLYVYCSNSRDLSRKDMSFDAVLNSNIGVGVKTFTAEKITVGKNEKVAEFTKNASLGDFKNLSRAGIFLKRFCTLMVVPGERAWLSCLTTIPSSRVTWVPASSPFMPVTISTCATEAMLGKASPRKPRVVNCCKSCNAEILLVAWR